MVSLVAATMGCSAEDKAGAGQGKGFPSKPITYLVWSSPGGKADLNARTMAPLLAKKLGTNIVVKNITGGGGVAATQQLLREPADGYTILEVSPTLLTLPFAPGADFKVSQVQPLAILDVTPFIILVPKDSPFKSLKEMIAYAKEHPGAVTVGGPFAIGNHRVHWTLFEQQAGIKTTWIPFDGSAEADAAVAGGKVQIETTTGRPGSIAQLVKAGKVRALAVSSSERIDSLPDVPTYKELGIDFERTSWDGIVTKKGVPSTTLTKLSAAVEGAAKSPQWANTLEKNDVTVGKATVQEFSDVLDKQGPEAARVVAKVNSGG